MQTIGSLRISALSLQTVALVVLALVLGSRGEVAAQTSRYTIDDVMDKVIEIDKRLAIVETEVKRNTERIETVNANFTKQIEILGDRMSDMNTTMLWFFGFLGTLFLGILGLTFATYRNTAGLVKAPDVRRASEEAGLLQALQEEVKALAERQKRLEKKVAAVSNS